MKVNESAENYLESILMIKNDKGYVRSVDVANKLSFTKASVSVAMKSFRESGFIIVDRDGNIELTDEGLKIAESVYERHRVIATALMAIGVSDDIAYKDACMVEHDISEETLLRLKEYLSNKNIEIVKQGAKK
ncbi:MAG: metal-dependent transcriptional regulator [Clostridia bacterium]|nr:metal-dependent transcriptional regulator [Clostridia bacterium]